MSCHIDTSIWDVLDPFTQDLSYAIIKLVFIRLYTFFKSFDVFRISVGPFSPPLFHTPSHGLDPALRDRPLSSGGISDHWREGELHRFLWVQDQSGCRQHAGLCPRHGCGVLSSSFPFLIKAIFCLVVAGYGQGRRRRLQTLAMKKSSTPTQSASADLCWRGGLLCCQCL